MGICFNADEVFALAERIEEDGARFYRQAARLQKMSSNADFLLKLAKMEDKHRATFALMRRSLKAKLKTETAFDPYLEASLYLNAMADSHGGEGTQAAIDALSARTTLQDILSTAIALEQKSIVFYVGIKDMVPEGLGKDKIDAIIVQEMGHVVVLTAELRKLKE